MRIFYKNIAGLKLPARANPGDAGYDVIATSPPNIIGLQGDDGLYFRIDYIEYSTNLFIDPEPNEKGQYHIDLRPRSSISKYNLALANTPATIDRIYRGEIKVRFKYIFQPGDFRIFNNSDGFRAIGGTVDSAKIYQQGDKIVQLLPAKTYHVEWIGVDKLEDSVRGSGGFGSTGA